jgi:parallel beta-helix repeat protein
MNRTAVACTAVASISAVAIAALLALGPLNPPSGAITSTNKTLSEVEPRIIINATNTPGDPAGDASPSLFKITQPGSYYLTGNITGVSGKHGIEIASGGVTIDLNGFQLTGVTGALDGIFLSTSAGLRGIVVKNGTVASWPGTGVNLASVNYSGRIENVHANSNGGSGIVGGNAYAISGCSATGNGSHGIGAFIGASITNCAARENAGTGFNVTLNASITNCTAFSNTQVGFIASTGSTIAHCSAHSNGTDGFILNSGVITNCTATNNTGDGIQVASSTTVLANQCVNNGLSAGDGAGIHATGSRNRIEGNNCTGADRGIDVDAAGNIIIRNTCSGNTTDWDIIANNIYGPIIDRRIPTPVASTPAVLGTSATSVLGSTDPNANFTY